jgi:large subunit ribosomal protein L3
MWRAESRRVGAVGQKLGMMQLWDDWGRRVTLTVVRIDRCQVTQVGAELSWNKKLVGVQLGAGTQKEKRVKKPQLFHFKKAGVEPKKKLFEFQVTPDAVLPVGFEVTARHFLAGQKVDVVGTTKGKGTQGVMGKWNFAGLNATMGVSKKHRAPGSIGTEGMGRVMKGKKMAGKFGNRRKTVQNLRVFKIDVRRNLLFLEGHVPGRNGGWLRVSDAFKVPFEKTNPPPFPCKFNVRSLSQKLLSLFRRLFSRASLRARVRPGV